RELRERYNLTGGNRMLFDVKPTPKATEYDLDPNTRRPKNEPEYLKPYDYEGKPDLPSQIRKIVNPNYKTGSREYTYNCQRCVIADELQWRGYDVVAKGYNPKDPIKNSGWAAWDVAPRGNDKYGFKVFDTVKNLGEKLDSAFEEWGDDARAVLRIQWKSKYGGNGHFLTIRKENGKVLIEDPQDGTTKDIDALLTFLSRSRNSHWLMRVDNRPLNENVKYAVENRRK
ncbi:hypothetical protein IKP13_04225, partial [bacterium]|nr:hypothetical protein [bacterium]